jgi:membrane protein
VLIVNQLSDLIPGLGYLWQAISFLLSFSCLTLLFAAIYTILPDAHIAWRSTVVGAAITSMLFIVGQFLFRLFLNQIDIGSAYGVAGSFVILITWIYYAAQILFLGAEFTKVYAKTQGSPIVPEEYAVHISHNNESQASPQPHSKRQNHQRRQKRDKGSSI